MFSGPEGSLNTLLSVYMSNELTKKAAIELEIVLKRYEGSNADTHTLLKGLESLIDDAKNGKAGPINSVPFGYAITEGLILLPKEVEAAYSKFALLLKLGEEKYTETKAWAENIKTELFNGNR
ncbi:hypothetical protein A3715_31080 [Oleiphilus sp. HI0009]|nr:hypothetical protein A3715_06555 [Oleiphilus sp. HI0009]KZX83818.1 hypothetical protein A3715_31080 [Oleiphilus sp. HI0009]